MRRFFRFRWVVQLLSGIGLNSYFPALWNTQKLYTGPLKSVPFPTLNCYASPTAVFSCPAGSLQHFSAIRTIPFYIFGVFMFVGSIGGRLFCGWLCPFGFLQDILKKVSPHRVSLPKTATYLKYLSLVVLVGAIPFITGDVWFCKLCPQGSLQGGIPQVILQPELRSLIGNLYWIKIAILIVFVVSFIFIPRLFCRTVCPVGAILSLFNRVSLLQMKVDMSRCNGCGLCRRVCPVDIEIYKDQASAECVRCFACTICPAISVGTVFGDEPKRIESL